MDIFDPYYIVNNKTNKVTGNNTFTYTFYYLNANYTNALTDQLINSLTHNITGSDADKKKVYARVNDYVTTASTDLTKTDAYKNLSARNKAIYNQAHKDILAGSDAKEMGTKLYNNLQKNGVDLNNSSIKTWANILAKLPQINK
jgi:hypothetical protein